MSYPLSRESLESLYSRGKSASEIANELNCSIPKVVYWMQKFAIPRRSHSEAAYLKLNPNGDPFTIRPSLRLNDDFLYGLGLGIYWGEGDKVRKGALRVANTDPQLIREYIKFLLEIRNLVPTKISYSIVCFNDSIPEEVVNYWSKQLGVSTEKF